MIFFPILFPPSYSPNPCHPWFPAVEEMGENRCVCECVCVCVCVTERTQLLHWAQGALPSGPCPLGELARCVPWQPVEPPGGCQRVSGMGVDGWEEALTAGPETVFMVQLGGLMGQEGGGQGRGKLPFKGTLSPPTWAVCQPPPGGNWWGSVASGGLGTGPTGQRGQPNAPAAQPVEGKGAGEARQPGGSCRPQSAGAGLSCARTQRSPRVGMTGDAWGG